MPQPTDARPALDKTEELALLRDLEPVVEANLNRHLAVAKEWFPHTYVPWSAGQDFDGPLGGTAWEPGQSKLDETARTSLILNLLTEDNLPSYHHEIALLFGRDGAWGTWVHRWTAEEGRHGAAIRDYLLTTRAVDPIALERARMTHMSTGYISPYDTRAVNSLAYTEATAGRGALLGVAYCLGLGIPFVLLAFGSAGAVGALGWLRRHTRAIQIFGGMLLVTVGALLVTGVWNDFISWLRDAFVSDVRLPI